MKKPFIALLATFLINLPSLYYGWYLKWWWLDIALHFSGGFFTAMFMAHYLKNHLLPEEKIKNALIVIGATVFVGVIWEFAEYIANQTLTEPIYKYLGIKAYFMGDLKDTVMDLLLDILGGLTFYGSHLFRSRNSHQIKGDL